MPVYEERATVEAAIADALFADLPVASRELVVVDDGSRDGTRDLLREGDWGMNVRVFFHDRNRGKGEAVRTALTHARGRFAAILDADLEYEAADLARLLRPLLAGEARVVFGTRAFTRETAYSSSYVIGNKAVTLATNVLFNSGISDVMTCHKAMSTELFRALRLQEGGFAIEAEIAAEVMRAGESIYEVPISYRARGRDDGKKLTAVDGVRVLRTLARCRLAGSPERLEEEGEREVRSAIREDLYSLREARHFGDWMLDQFSEDIRGDVAEIGAGIGTFSERLLRRPISSLLMLEPDEESAARLDPVAANDQRARVAVEALPEAPSLDRESVDFVLCLNVIEHIRDDAGALQAIGSALRPGGSLGLLVPAHPRLFGPLDRRYGHIRRYTPDSLSHVVEGAGLVIRDLRRFNALGVPGWWAKNRRPDGRLDHRSLKLYDAAVPIWRRIEPLLGPPAGLSLVVRATRPLKS